MLRKFQGYGFLKNLRFFDPFLVLFFREMGFTFLEIGGLISIRELAINLLEIPTGIIADGVGRRRAMLASFGCYLLSFVVFYALPRFGACAGAMVLFALGETFRSGTHKAMILEHLRICGIESRKTEYYGRTRAASQFGSAVAALVAAGLVLYVGNYRIVFLASIVPYLLAMVLVASYPRALDGSHMKGVRLGERMRTTMVGSLGLVRDRVLLRSLFAAAGFDAVFKSAKDYIQPVLQTQALLLPIALSAAVPQRTAILVGAAFFLIYLGTSWAASYAGRFKDRIGERRALDGTYLVGLLLLGAAGAAAILGWYAVSIAAFVVVFMVQNIRRPVVIGQLAERIPREVTATGLSVEAQIRTILMAAGAPLLGWMADRWGVGIAVATIAAVGIILWPLIRQREHRDHGHGGVA